MYTSRFHWMGLLLVIFNWALIPISGASETEAAPDIQKLSRHFYNPGPTDPWIFVPEDNIKRLSTTEHPGLLSIWSGEKEKDIKGLLKQPIRITDFRVPWQFQCSWMQN